MIYDLNYLFLSYSAFANSNVIVPSSDTSFWYNNFWTLGICSGWSFLCSNFVLSNFHSFKWAFLKNFSYDHTLTFVLMFCMSLFVLSMNFMPRENISSNTYYYCYCFLLLLSSSSSSSSPLSLSLLWVYDELKWSGMAKEDLYSQLTLAWDWDIALLIVVWSDQAFLRKIFFF